jgi:rhodanese-related sulfurtransferase
MVVAGGERTDDWPCTSGARAGPKSASEIYGRPIRNTNTTVMFFFYNIQAMSSIRPKELDDRLNSESSDEPFLLDIRPEAEFGSMAIDRSRNIPVYDDLRRGDESELRNRLDEIPRGRDVIVVCKMGVVAKRATNVLRDEGYNASTLRGGMSGWKGYQNSSLSYKLRSLIWRVR